MYKVIKRIIDLILSIVLLIVLSPIWIITFVLIKATSEGEIIFKQKRLGKYGKEFYIYKFRTMVKDAVNQGKGIFIEENDSRITRIGHTLRKTSLDELPQLINIIKGEMSFVGPRPPLTYFPYKFEDYPKKQKQRFNVPPGITGWAQVNGRNSISWDEKIKWDLEYIKKQSFLFDLKIVLKTMVKVIKKENIYEG